MAVTKLYISFGFLLKVGVSVCSNISVIIVITDDKYMEAK